MNIPIQQIGTKQRLRDRVYPIKCTMITCICFHCDCLVSDSPASKCRSCCVRGTSKHKSVPAGNKLKNKLCLKSISIKTNHCINATENMPPTQDGDHTLIMSRRLLWNYVSLSNLIVQCRWKTHQSQRQNREMLRFVSTSTQNTTKKQIIHNIHFHRL